MGITETRKKELKEMQNQINILNKSIQKVIDGKSSMSDFAKSLNMTPQRLNREANIGLYSLLRKIKVLNNSDLEQLLRDSQSPAERLISRIFGTDELIILNIVEENKFIKIMKKALTEREYDIITYRYGFIDNDTKTLEETAKIFKVTPVRIRQIEMLALRKLRCKNWMDELLPNYDLRIKALQETHHMRNLNIKLIKQEEIAKDVMQMNINTLGLSIRPYNCLIRNNINTIGELSRFTLKDLRQINYLGNKSINEINNKLNKLGVILREK